MSTQDYAIAEQDNGWIYVIEGRSSAVFASREEAEEAAQSAVKNRAERDDELEQGLEETFPASDPVSVTHPNSN
ncbi:hypothetical protein [Oricola indica]|jgi:hypothetical protein|uniref:hypothetical protein n=1 Tax=Oricola indica TaxID=2872591 RepID=UPI001CC1877F|nr:hypothetical protein [Oricola indica]